MSLIIGLDHVNLLIDAGDDALSAHAHFTRNCSASSRSSGPPTPTAATPAHGTNAAGNSFI